MDGKLTQLLLIVLVAGVDDVFNTDIFQHLNLLRASYCANGCDFVVLAELDQHTADLRASGSNDHTLGSELPNSLNHTNSCHRVDHKRCDLVKVHIVTHREHLHAVGDTVFGIGATILIDTLLEALHKSHSLSNERLNLG